MAKPTREFSLDAKRETVAPLENGGPPLMRVAIEVGIWPSMLRNWRAAGMRGLRATASPADHASEITRLNASFQEVLPATLNHVWLTDIADIVTGEGWLYLAASLDLATRKMMEWSTRP